MSDHLPANWEYVAHSASFTPGGATRSDRIRLARERHANSAGKPRIELAPGESTVLTYEARPTLAAETNPGSGEAHPNENSASATREGRRRATRKTRSGPFAAGPANARAILILPELEVTKVPVRATVERGRSGLLPRARAQLGRRRRRAKYSSRTRSPPA